MQRYASHECVTEPGERSAPAARRRSPNAARMLRDLALLALAATLGGCGGVASQLDPVGCPHAEVGFSGRVIDQKSRKPISGVQVRTDPRTDIAHTDLQGCFVISADVRADDKAIAPGRYRVELELRDDDVALAGRPTTAVFLPRDTDPVDYVGEPLSLGIIQVARAPRPTDDSRPERPETVYSKSITVPSE